MSSKKSKTPRTINIPEYLPFLLSRIGLAFEEVGRSWMKARGITLPMWRVLAALSHSGDQQLREVADLIDIEVSNLSKIIRAMEKKGLVSRRRSQSDGRAISLHLTARGWELVDVLVPENLANEKNALAGLNKNATEELKTTLRIILNNLRIMLDEQRDCS